MCVGKEEREVKTMNRSLVSLLKEGSEYGKLPGEGEIAMMRSCS
jgi:hypothetical protein